MKSHSTTLWFVLAAALAAGIWFLDRQLQPAPLVERGLLPGMRAAAVDSVQVTPLGERELSVVRTNRVWELQKPLAGSAQAPAIEALLAALEKLSPTLRLTATELQSHKNADAEFGFENPQFRVDVNAGAQSWHLVVGNRTAPGDGVYVRLVGGPAVFVTSLDWLQFLPRNTAAWRDTALVGDVATVDFLVLTNGPKVIELRRDTTNGLWRMTRPIAARANTSYIVNALQQLRAARIEKFVTDDPQADLTAYGLQPPEFSVWLGRGTNLVEAVHAGKDSLTAPGQAFARREGWNSVVSVGREFLLPWRGDVNDFRSPHLLELAAMPGEIVVSGESSYTLRHETNGAWRVAGESFAVEPESVAMLVQLLANFRISDFVKDVVTATDLQGFGLGATNSRTITLRAAGGTNAVLAELQFGAADAQKIYVKRADENFMYALAQADLARLPEQAWEFRERRVWTVALTNLAGITMKQGGRTRQVLRTAPGKWSLAAGSQGIIDPVGLEETAKQLVALNAAGWVGRNFSAPEKYGFNPDNLSVALELKTGETLALDFGSEIPAQNSPTALAAVTLNGERWAFVFPPSVFQLVAAYLTVPPGAP